MDGIYGAKSQRSLLTRGFEALKRLRVGAPSVSRRKRVLMAVVVPLLVVYSLITLFPFYVLFVRTFVSTKEATDLHLWIPSEEEISMRAEIGNLSIFYNLDIGRVKADLGIPLGEYITPRTTLAEISEEYDVPVESIKAYFKGFGRYNGWFVLFKEGKIYPALARSALVTVVSLVLVNFLSIGTGYGLAGLLRKDQNLIYNLFILQMVIPPMLIILPQYMVIQWFLKLFPGSADAGVSRYAGQIIALILLNIKGGAMSTMLFTAAIGAIPRDIEDSALIDGASRWQYFVHILLPLMKVPIASLTVILLPSLWNQFLQPYVYLDPKNATLMPLIQQYAGQYTTNYQVAYTAIFVSILPLVTLYIIFRRWFIRGAMAGAIKG
jgi:raffinose/stachyose/melibiose transport system permease protein